MYNPCSEILLHNLASFGESVLLCPSGERLVCGLVHITYEDQSALVRLILGLVDEVNQTHQLFEQSHAKYRHSDR